MTKVMIDLPTHVVRAPRPGGKVDFYFTVKRGRPQHWGANIRLPRDAALRTRDGSPAEIAAVIADGDDLNRQLEMARAGTVTTAAVRGSLEWLMNRWQTSDDWPAKKKTAEFYEQGWKHIKPWADKNGSRSVASLKWPAIFKFVSRFSDKPGVQREVLNVLQRLCRIAVDEGIIDRSPFEGHQRRRWKTKESAYAVQVCDYEHVRHAVKLFLRQGRRSLAVATLIAFELMQYPEQVAAFRRGQHYDPKTGEFLFNRNKTGVACRVTVSRTLRWFLRKTDLYLVVSEETGRPYTPGVLAKTFRRILKDDAVFGTFQMRWFRHSGVFEARRSGLDLETIADIGAWKSSGAVQSVIDKHYRVPDGKLASAGQAKRHAYRNAERTKSLTEARKIVLHPAAGKAPSR